VALVTPEPAVELKELGRVHFIGIGGVGMSGVARVMLTQGVPVSGSETVPSDELTALTALGATVHLGQDVANLDGVDTVVYSTAIRPGNVELAEARRPSLLLGRHSVVVAGTHGKTTTTSMLATVLRRCGANPGYVIGGVLTETQISADDAHGELFVAEADESDGSFLMLKPDLAIVTCVEADHLDNYGGLAEIQDAFAEFTRGIKPGGVLVACADDPGASALAQQARQAGLRVRTYGDSAAADYRVTRAASHGMSVRFGVEAGPHAAAGAPPSAQLEAGAPGRHNALNATAAYAAALELGLAAEPVSAALAQYRGAQRRMEPKGVAGGVAVLDTYAHHPTELAADLRAAREIRPGGRVIAVFQPHLYSRTRIFAAEFGAALALADEVIVLDVYGAREDPEPGVSGRMVSDAVPGGRAHFAPRREQVPALAARLARPGDLILTMGAGDVTALGPLIVAALAEPAGVPGD
jgi:UDP-N-acetylmuramate--alanine ligase